MCQNNLRYLLRFIIRISCKLPVFFKYLDMLQAIASFYNWKPCTDQEEQKCFDVVPDVEPGRITTSKAESLQQETEQIWIVQHVSANSLEYSLVGHG